MLNFCLTTLNTAVVIAGQRCSVPMHGLLVEALIIMHSSFMERAQTTPPSFALLQPALVSLSMAPAQDHLKLCRLLACDLSSWPACRSQVADMCSETSSAYGEITEELPAVLAEIRDGRRCRLTMPLRSPELLLGLPLPDPLLCRVLALGGSSRYRLMASAGAAGARRVELAAEAVAGLTDPSGFGYRVMLGLLLQHAPGFYVTCGSKGGLEGHYGEQQSDQPGPGPGGASSSSSGGGGGGAHPRACDSAAGSGAGAGRGHGGGSGVMRADDGSGSSSQRSATDWALSLLGQALKRTYRCRLQETYEGQRHCGALHPQACPAQPMHAAMPCIIRVRTRLPCRVSTMQP